jgi:hypothetical protein
VNIKRELGHTTQLLLRYWKTSPIVETSMETNLEALWWVCKFKIYRVIAYDVKDYIIYW